jgi:hypothetical protein
MKSKIFFLVVLFSISFTSAQTIEILTAVGSELLPKAVEGVKDILGTAKNNGNIKTTEKKIKEKVEPFKEYALGIAKGTQTTAENFYALSRSVNPASKVMDNAGALKALSNTQLITTIINSNNENVQRQYAYRVEEAFNAVKTSIDELTSDINALTIDQSLKETLNIRINSIDSRFEEIKGNVANSGVSDVTALTPPTQLGTYLSYFEQQSSRIENLTNTIEDFFSIQESRTSTFVNGSKSLVKDINDKWNSINFSDADNN